MRCENCYYYYYVSVRRGNYIFKSLKNMFLLAACCLPDSGTIFHACCNCSFCGCAFVRYRFLWSGGHCMYCHTVLSRVCAWSMKNKIIKIPPAATIHGHMGRGGLGVIRPPLGFFLSGTSLGFLVFFTVVTLLLLLVSKNFRYPADFSPLRDVASLEKGISRLSRQ